MKQALVCGIRTRWVRAGSNGDGLDALSLAVTEHPFGIEGERR
jgi:hypothetical protein